MLLILGAVVGVYLSYLFLGPTKKSGAPYGTKTGPATWRNANVETLRRTPKPGVDSLAKLFDEAVKANSNARCLGTRAVLSEEKTEVKGKVFVKQTRGEYSWRTYAEVAERVAHIGSGFVALGLKPESRVAVFADTCEDWQTTAQACFRYNIVVVTIYATLGDEAIVHAINLTECTAVITSSNLVKKVLELSAQLKTVDQIVYFGELEGATPAASLPMKSLAEVERLGDAVETPQKPAINSDTAVIMFTSGSTGLPKGVVISHGNLLAAVAGLVPTIPNFGPQDTYIAYLPLAHVLELVAELCSLSVGCGLGYSSPHTLSDASLKIKAGTKGDVGVLKPTVMAAVPAVMEKIRKAVNAKINAANPVVKALFEGMAVLRWHSLRTGLPVPLAGLIFNKTKALLGGRVRLVLSGGAPLSASTEQFMNVCFGCPVGQGYGLTETCGGATIKANGDMSAGRVGPPAYCCEIKLVDWPEGGYLTSDKPYPRGEVCIGGAHVTQGYYKKPEKTKAEFKEEDGQRWFYTGDVGEMHPDGCLKIVDRKKDLVKLQHGEYISLGKIEATLKTCPVVENCCVYASSHQDYCLVIVVPQEPNLKAMASEIGASGDFEELCDNPNVAAELLKRMQETARESKLHKTEIPKKVIVTSTLWTPENELVTAALKLKRNNVQKHYKEQLDAAYA